MTNQSTNSISTQETVEDVFTPEVVHAINDKLGVKENVPNVLPSSLSETDNLKLQLAKHKTNNAILQAQELARQSKEFQAQAEVLRGQFQDLVRSLFVTYQMGPEDVIQEDGTLVRKAQ